MLQVIRLLLNFAVYELEWIEINPASGIKLFGTQKEHLPWTVSARSAFVKTCEHLNDDVMLAAYHLGTCTGQRPGEICGMKLDHYDGEYIAVVQDKTDARIWVYCPLTLRTFLEQRPKRGAYILAANLTEPLGYNAIEKRFRVIRTAAGDNLKGLSCMVGGIRPLSPLQKPVAVTPRSKQSLDTKRLKWCKNIVVKQIKKRSVKQPRSNEPIFNASVSEKQNKNKTRKWNKLWNNLETK